MTQQDYEKAWLDIAEEWRISPDSTVCKDIFDRAYALGKQTETISQEDVEKASKEFAKSIIDSFGRNGVPCGISDILSMIADGFKSGASFSLGKQEKDANSFEIGDKVRVKETNQIGTIIEPYSNDVGYRVYFDDGDGGEDAEYSADQLELYKKIIIEPKDADTVIQGWACRDNNSLNAQVLIGDKPKRTGFNYWENKSADCITLPKDLFPDLTWDDDPQEVEIIIKRKKNG